MVAQHPQNSLIPLFQRLQLELKRMPLKIPPSKLRSV